ncbi:MAG: bifunctional phosphoribosylaminoimidazolecarboxamide formyltransferase/IMP cyclohydrolase [Coriobacteriales bacterium]|jgi:phosphoribosylaminoimidazolecarboxamide formyltransferase/IMP cyclohydrolase|nr:bifunctional phosphoribosylaminoimidazolecarboxamide formyltransferase/IMP cyclohydrolase [Coriobacteriales bacterium]
MPKQELPIKRALLSVTDKTGIADLARTLSEEFGVEIVSTGGTARVLEDAGIPVRPIDDLTGFPEMMEGRVKTLHPRVHGGLLARRDKAEHLSEAAEHGIGLIDLVVVNLYAFEETVARPDVAYDEAIEHIDIGGPSMLRSAAKNHAAVTVVIRPEHYAALLEEMRAGGGATTRKTRKRLALEVFEATSAYDNAIYSWLYGALCAEGLDPEESRAGAEPLPSPSSTPSPFPRDARLFLSKVQDLRYGENPHQRAAFYLRDGGGNEHTLAHATQHQGKELSYNNYLDLDAAWTAVREFSEPTVVIVKHLTPCGIASHEDLKSAYRLAFACDPISAFGGVMAFNRTVPARLIDAIYAEGQFVEALIAPGFEPAALELLAQKPNIRVLATGGLNAPGEGFDFRSVEGGMLCMDADSAEIDERFFTVASLRQPTEEELHALRFAWKACKSVKSNAIVVVQDEATVGIGAGQPNRVNAAELAVRQAGDKARGAVAASDAFMPFADSLEVLARAGVTAVIQPGGSVRDEEVLAAADAAEMAVVFTGRRHFRH